jgi:sugar phosphate isomerase/epimerase
MKLGLSSLLFVGDTIENAVEKTAGLGAECIEIIYDFPHFPPNFDQRELKRIKELVNSHRLEVSVHASFWDLNPATFYRELYDLTLKQVRRSIEACRRLGGEIVAVHFGKCPVPDVPAIRESTKKRYAEFVARCSAYSREHGVTLALENAGGGAYWYPSNIRELKKLVERFEGVKITFDVAHAHLAERKAGVKLTSRAIAADIRRAKEYLAHVHLHDNHGIHDEHLPMGEGEIDFRPVARALQSISYDGFVIAELWNPRRPLQAGRKGMKELRKLFRKS